MRVMPEHEPRAIRAMEPHRSYCAPVGWEQRGGSRRKPAHAGDTRVRQLSRP